MQFTDNLTRMEQWELAVDIAMQTYWSWGRLPNAGAEVLLPGRGKAFMAQPFSRANWQGYSALPDMLRQAKVWVPGNSERIDAYGDDSAFPKAFQPMLLWLPTFEFHHMAGCNTGPIFIAASH